LEQYPSSIYVTARNSVMQGSIFTGILGVHARARLQELPDHLSQTPPGRLVQSRLAVVVSRSGLFCIPPEHRRDAVQIVPLHGMVKGLHSSGGGLKQNNETSRSFLTSGRAFGRVRLP
jgi:hypothetical protein